MASQLKNRFNSLLNISENNPILLNSLNIRDNFHPLIFVHLVKIAICRYG